MAALQEQHAEAANPRRAAAGESHACSMAPEAFEASWTAALAFLDTLASTSRLAFGFNRSGRAPHVLAAS